MLICPLQYVSSRCLIQFKAFRSNFSANLSTYMHAFTYTSIQSLRHFTPPIVLRLFNSCYTINAHAYISLIQSKSLTKNQSIRAGTRTSTLGTQIRTKAIPSTKKKGYKTKAINCQDIVRITSFVRRQKHVQNSISLKHFYLHFITSKDPAQIFPRNESESVGIMLSFASSLGRYRASSDVHILRQQLKINQYYV